MKLHEIRISAGEILKVFRQKSAMYSLLYFCVLVGIPCLYFSKNEDGSISWPFFVLGSTPVFLFVVAYLYFMITDPDRLHSEEFQTTSRALGIAESKGGGIEFDRTNLAAIANPQPLQPELLGKTEGEDRNE